MYRYIILSCTTLLVMLSLIACNTIEHRSDLPKKKDLPKINNQLALAPIWKMQAGHGVGKKDAKLLLAKQGENLYTVDYKGTVLAINSNNGSIIWQKALHIPATSGPAVNEGKVVIGTSDTKAIALDAKTGSIIWEAKTASEILAAAKIEDNMAYIISSDGGLNAFNLQNGRQNWRFSTNIPALTLRRNSTPVVTKEYVIAGFASGKLMAIKLIDGIVDWSQDVSQPKGNSELQRMVDISADLVLDNNIVYAASYHGNLGAYSAIDGQQLWEKNISSYAGFTISNNILYVTATNGDILALDKNTGDTYWLQSDLQGRRLSKPAIAGNYIIIGDEDGVISVLERNTGKIIAFYQFDSKGIEAAPLVAENNNIIYVLGRSGTLLSLRLQPLEAR